MVDLPTSSSAAVGSGSSPSSFEKVAFSRSSQHADAERRRLLNQSIASHLSFEDDNSLASSCSDGEFGEDSSYSSYDESSDEEGVEEDTLREEYRLEAIQRRQQLAAGEIESAEGAGQHTAASPGDLLSKYLSNDAGMVVVHFYQKNNARCKLMDKNLIKLAAAHKECRFVHVNSELAPLLLMQFAIKTLPCLMVFRNGEDVDRLAGIGDFRCNAISLTKWLVSAGAIATATDKK